MKLLVTLFLSIFLCVSCEKKDPDFQSGEKALDLIVGCWSQSEGIVVRLPASFCFNNDSTVIAAWEPRDLILRSYGRYEFTDNNHVKIELEKESHYGGVYTFEIVKLTKMELILRSYEDPYKDLQGIVGSNFQDIIMRRAE